MALARLWDRHRSRLKPRRVDSYLDFARRVTLPDGRAQGSRYRPESHQVQRAILEAMDSGGWKSVTIVKPVQDGGTLISLIPLFRRVVEQHQTVVLAYPTLDAARDIWTTKVWPILRAFGGIMPTSGGGSQGGAARVIRLPGGGQFILRAAGGRGESGQASITGDAVQVDEAEDWPSIHRIKLIGLRIEEAPDPLIVHICTVKRQQDSIILALYEGGSKSRMQYPCVECGRYDTMEWDRVSYEIQGYRVVPGSERIACRHCAFMHDEHGRRIMLANGRLLHGGQSIDEHGALTGEPIIGQHLSVLWTRLESPRKTMLSLCESYMEAKMFLEVRGEHGPMKSFFQDYLCQPYTGDLEELEMSGRLTFHALLAKANESGDWISRAQSDQEQREGRTIGYHTRHIAEPPGTGEFTVAGVDVQHNRLYWVLVAGNRAGTSWDFCWGIEYAREDHGPADEPEMRQLFDKTARLMVSLSGDLPFMVGAIDCGDQTDMVRSWVAQNARTWRAVRGSATKMKAQDGDIDGIAYLRDGVIYIAVDNVRESYQAALRRPNDAPGAVIFPGGLGQSDTHYFRNLCSRQTAIDPKTKKKTIVRASGREDLLDARIYADAMRIGHIQAARLMDAQKAVAAGVAAAQRAEAVRVSQEDAPVRVMAQEPRAVRVGGHMQAPMARRTIIGGNRRWRR